VVSEKQSRQYDEATRLAERKAALWFLGETAAAIASTAVMSALFFILPAINWIVMGLLLAAGAGLLCVFWFLRKGAYGFLALLLTLGGWLFLGTAMFVAAGDGSGRERLGWLPIILVVVASIQLESWRKLSAALRGDR
jgi:hypothetical protein